MTIARGYFFDVFLAAENIHPKQVIIQEIDLQGHIADVKIFLFYS